MNVLSLFDGMSCGQLAINKAGFKINNYFASEIDKYCIKVTQSNFTNTIQLGDVTKIDLKSLPKIDLLIGGSPCQGFSFIGNQLNFEHHESKLFFDFVRILNEIKPKYFLLENVKMKKEHEVIISRYLNVEPILINSSLLSAQNRERNYWTNIMNSKDLFGLNVCNIPQPKDKNLLLKDIIQPACEVDKKYFLSKKMLSYLKLETNIYCKSVKPKELNQKSFCIVKNEGLVRTSNFIYQNNKLRKLTTIEIERLQTVQDNYTNFVCETQRRRMLGNGMTIDIIAYILKFMKF